MIVFATCVIESLLESIGIVHQWWQIGSTEQFQEWATDSTDSPTSEDEVGQMLPADSL
jgi:hypothetical protein